MVFTLIPVIVSFYVFAPRGPTIGTPKGSTLGVAGALLLFGGTLAIIIEYPLLGLTFHSHRHGTLPYRSLVF